MAYTGKQIDYDSRQKAYWDTQLFLEGTVRTEVTDPQLIAGSAMAVLYTRSTPAGTTEDTAQFQVHYVMRPGTQGLSSHLSASDMTAVESDFNAKVRAVLTGLQANTWTHAETVWRDFGANFPLTQPDDPIAVPPVHKYGPAKQRTSYAVTGQKTFARMPDQVAATITLRTASRKHWGRCYMGGFAVDSTTAATFGRINSPNVDDLANAWHTHFAAVGQFARVIEPVVWSARYGAILTVDQLVMDDVFDVIRRRRAKMASYRKVLG